MRGVGACFLPSELVASSYYDFETSGLHSIELERDVVLGQCLATHRHVWSTIRSLLRCFLVAGMWLSGGSVDELQTDNDLGLLPDGNLLAQISQRGVFRRRLNEPSLTDVVCEKLRALEGSSQMDISQIKL